MNIIGYLYTFLNQNKNQEFLDVISNCYYSGRIYHQVWHTVVLIKILPYSGATAQTCSVALWGVSGSYGQAPAQQGMSGLVRETSHLWLYSSPSPSLQPILGEPATSILIVLYTFKCIMWVATESLWKYVQGNKWILKLHFHIFFSPCDWSDALKRRISYMLSIYRQTAIYVYISVIWTTTCITKLLF